MRFLWRNQDRNAFKRIFDPKKVAKNPKNFPCETPTACVQDVALKIPRASASIQSKTGQICTLRYKIIYKLHGPSTFMQSMRVPVVKLYTE